MEKNFRFQQYSNSHFRVEGKNADHKTITHKVRISAPHGVTETILKRFCWTEDINEVNQHVVFEKVFL